MVELKDDMEARIWQIILDAYGYDEDTHLFLRDCRSRGVIGWALQRARFVESDLAFMKYKQGMSVCERTLNDAMVIRRLLELLHYGEDSGKYLGKGDHRLKSSINKKVDIVLPF